MNKHYILLFLLLILISLSGCASYDYLLCGDDGVYKHTAFGSSAICYGDLACPKDFPLIARYKTYSSDFDNSLKLK